MSDTEYRFTVRPLSEEEGGGYFVEYPDLPGCMSDGETIEEAIVDAEDAKRCWIAAMQATQSLSRWLRPEPRRSPERPQALNPFPGPCRGPPGSF